MSKTMYDNSSKGILSKPKSKMNEAELLYADLELRKTLDKLPSHILNNPDMLKEAIRILAERAMKDTNR